MILRRAQDEDGLSQDDFAGCEAVVRKADYDRYLAALFAPAALRVHLFALYAFNHEIARIAESVSQPMAGLIRLQWWRDAIDEIYEGAVRRHDVAQALAATIKARSLPRDMFDILIDARESDLDETPFADLDQLEAYADATSGGVMRLALRILGAGDARDEAAQQAGIAYALTGLLRALPFHAARRRLMLPVQMLKHAGVSPEDVFAGRASAGLNAVLRDIAEHAHAQLTAAKKHPVQRRFLPALLPAASVPIYLDVVTGAGFNPFRDVTEVPVYRRQIAMLRAMLRGRL
jgi:phytoene synthase